MNNESHYQYNEVCLYFAANSLTRSINEMTETAFNSIGISASYGHLMLLIIDNPNQNIGALSKQMNLKASTMTRFIDKLAQKQLVTRHSIGRTVTITPTKKGKALRPKIMDALKTLYLEYCEVLGEDFAIQLTKNINTANEKLFE